MKEGSGANGMMILDRLIHRKKGGSGSNDDDNNTNANATADNAGNGVENMKNLTSNEKTLQTYLGAVGRMSARGVSLEELAKVDDKRRTDILVKYVRELGRSRLTTSSIRTELAGIRRYCESNRLGCDFRFVSLNVRKDDVQRGGRTAYTDGNVSAMYSHCRDARERLIFTFLATTAVRPAAITDHAISLSDIERISHEFHNSKAYGHVRIYKDTKSEYISIMSMDCMRLVDGYIHERAQKGMTLGVNAPLFAGRSWQDTISQNELTAMFRRLVKEAGIARPKTTGHRRDIPLIYGLRKRWNTRAKTEKGINIALIEKLLGHEFVKLDSSYLRPTPEILLGEYRKIETAVSIRA